MYSIVIVLDGLERKIDTLAEFAEDLSKPLAMLGARLKAKALERYKAQAFAPLAAATLEKRIAKGLNSLESKLKSDVRRAYKKSRESRAPRGLLERILTPREVLRATEDAISSQSKGVKNRTAVLAEFQRRYRKSLDLKDMVQGRALTIKQSESLTARTRRAVTKALSKPILGGLDRTLTVKVDFGSVTLRSATHETWSAAHNEGTAVGNGAQLPKRETIMIEQDDLDYFVEVLKEHMLLPFSNDGEV